MSKATNWNRAFQMIHQELKYLNSFAMINQIASEYLILQLMKDVFEIEDNIINKDLKQFLEAKKFVDRQGLN